MAVSSKIISLPPVKPSQPSNNSTYWGDFRRSSFVKETPSQRLSSCPNWAVVSMTFVAGATSKIGSRFDDASSIVVSEVCLLGFYVKVEVE